MLIDIVSLFIVAIVALGFVFYMARELHKDGLLVSFVLTIIGVIVWAVAIIRILQKVWE